MQLPLPARLRRTTVGHGGVPRIDWANPISNGLIGCFIPSITGGYNIAGGVNLVPAGVPTSTNPFVTTIEGGAWAPGTAQGGFQGLATPPWLTGNITLYFRGQWGGSGDSNTFGVEYNNPEGSPFLVVAVGAPFAEGLSIGTEWNTGGSFTPGSLVGYSANTFFSVAGTFAVGGNAILYKNGVQVASNAFGASPPNTTATSTIVMQSSTASLTRTVTISQNIAFAWSYPLSGSQITELDSQPYSLLIWPEDEIFATLTGPAAAPPPSGTPFGLRLVFV